MRWIQRIKRELMILDIKPREVRVGFRLRRDLISF